MEETVELDLEAAPQATPSEAAPSRIPRTDTDDHSPSRVRAQDP